MDNSTQNEVWLPVVGYEGIYEVSSLGRIKRIKAITSGKAGCILRLYKNHNGYLKLTLSKEGKQKNRTVHTLVADAFLGQRFAKVEVNHKNGVKIDNAVENLEYVTKSQNQKHAFVSGLKKSQKGEANYYSKLTNSQVVEIRLLKDRYSQSQLSKMFGVSQTCIHKVLRQKTWEHI